MKALLALSVGIAWAATWLLLDYVMGRPFDDKIYFTVFACSATAYWLGLRHGAREPERAA